MTKPTLQRAVLVSGGMIHDYNTMKKLVELGYVKNYTGSRMADLYCIADKEKFEALKNELNDAFEIYEKEKEIVE